MNLTLYRRLSAVLFVSAVLLMMVAVPLPSVAATNGPRTNDMVMYYYSNVENAFAALRNDEVDVVLYELTSTQFNTAKDDPNLVTGKVADSGFYEFDLNNNYSIDDFPGIRSPMNYSEMRQAIALMSDKDYIVGTICGGFCERIDQMIAAPYKGWGNASMWDPYYPWDFNLIAAKAKLDSKFPEGGTSNPYYDPLHPEYSAPKLRAYPAGHSKAGQDLDPLVVCVRTDDNRRFQAGQLVYNNMRKLGLPVNAMEGPRASLYDRVMGQFNYHLYTGGWGVGRFPPITLYGLYHSINSFAYGSNYVTGQFLPFDPINYISVHPKLDTLLYDANYALTYSAAVGNCKLAAGYMTEICVNVPLWSATSYWCWQKKLLGVVNREGSGPHNGYTFMNAYKTDGSPIRVATINAPNAMNIVYSSWVYDYNNLDRMNLYGGIDVPPYNLAADQPGFVEDWDTLTWDGATKTMVTQTYVKDGYFCEPVTGDQGANVDAYTYYKNAWYDYQVGDGWSSTGFIDLDHINIVSQYQSDIYFTTLSYWNTYYCQGPLRPLDNWATTALVNVNTESIELTAPDTPSPITLNALPFWFVSVEFEGSPLALGTGYNIVRGELYIYNALGAGTLDIEYWSPGDARGFTPGNLAWQTILEGAGMYYCTAFTAGDGGSITLKRNPGYFMQTPLLGDIDFVKEKGHGYVIDLADAGLAAAAYGSQGILVPDDNWFPGADLATPGGVIDVYDITTITGSNWLKEYDVPPP